MDYQEKTKDELLKEILLLKAENERLKSAPNAAYNETENIRQSELRYERFFEDNHSTMLLVYPETGEIKDANPAACQFYGWTRAEMQKMNIADINTLSMQEIKAEMQNSISDKGRQFFFKHRLANAEVRDVEVYSGPIIFDNVTYLYSIIHDISDIKHAEEKLRLNEERYRNIFETVQDAYYEATPDGILLDVSPSIETISRGQLTRDELIGKSMVGIYADPEARAKLYSQLLSLGKVIDYELMLLNKDGSVVPVAISTTIIKDAEGNPLKFTGSMRDISERKLVEDKIRQNEEKYRKDLLLLNSIFESPVNIIVFSLDTNYCYTAFTKYHAQTMKHIWGIDIQVGTNMLNMISVLEDRNKAKHNFDRVFNGENFVLTEEYGDDVLYRTYYENYYSPVKNSLGEISGVSVFVIDATERMQTTKSLEHSEERFSQVVAQSHEVVWELNTEGLYTYISPIASEIYGYSPEEMIGKMFYYDFLKVDQRVILKKRAIEFFQQNDIYYNFISTIEKKDGAERILSSNGIKLSNEKGEWLGFRGISADITDKLIAEEELAKFHTIADQAYYGAAITSLDGNFLYVNNALSNMMGWEENELLGKSINVVHNQDQSQRVAEILDILRTNGGFTYEEVDHTRKDGSIFPTLMTAKVILDKNNKPEFVSTNVIDISDRKQAEETLIQKSAILTNLIINLKEGILLENAARQIELTNQLFCDMFGIPVPPDAMVGADCSDSAEQSKILFKNPDKFVADIHQILANKKAVFNDELELVDGRYFERDYIPTYLHDRYSGHLWKYRDITGKKLAEIELKKISQAVEQSPVMTIIANLAGNIEYVNPAFTKVTGYSRDELYGQNPRILSSGEKSKEDYRKLWKTISLGNEWHGEFHNKKKNGESYWAGAIISAIFDSKGKITHYVSVEENITHRKQIEKELLDLNSNLEFKIKERTKLLFESEQKYKSVVENINEVIFQTDTEGLWLFLNPAWEKITGFTVDESIGKLFLDYVHPEDRERNTELFEPLILRKKEYCRHEIRYLTKDGSFRWIEVFARLGLNDNDEIIGTYGTLQDVTERKLSVSALEESEQRFSAFMEYLPAVVFLKDHEGRTLFVNKFMDNAFGASQWMGKTMLEVFPGELGEKFVADDINSIQMGYQRIEESMYQLDGQLHDYETQKFTINRLGREPLLGGIALDITDRKIAEEELRIARIEADRANMAKSEFLSSMSHELRTPLNSILGFAQLMEMGELNLNQKKGITHIKQSGAHLLQLINQVLDISRIESGRLNISIEPVQLNAVLNEMLDLIKPLAAGNKIHFELIDSPVNKLFVNADRQSLKQILLNLMNNAIKYNKEKGSVKIKTELKSGTNNETLVIRISIADSGVGIKSIDIPKLFTPFERIGSEKSDIEGTGLGLAVVKKLTEAMDGICGVESDFGKGSTFWIELPQANEYNIVEMLDNLTDTNPKLKEKQATVLYIEDNIPNIELVEEVLSSQRPLIRLITNIYGKQTVKLAIEFKPSIILLDLNLPDINGFEVLNQILDNPKTKDIPVVIISADGMQQQIDKLLKAGAKKYLTKPLEIREFLITIDELI